MKIKQMRGKSKLIKANCFLGSMKVVFCLFPFYIIQSLSIRIIFSNFPLNPLFQNSKVTFSKGWILLWGWGYRMGGCPLISLVTCGENYYRKVLKHTFIPFLLYERVNEVECTLDEWRFPEASRYSECHLHFNTIDRGVYVTLTGTDFLMICNYCCS